jgi:Flp pilus assembly secretin CpaC
MLLLDAMLAPKAKKKTSAAWAVGGALVVLALGAGVPTVIAAQEPASGLIEVLAGGKRTKELRPITESSDAYLSFAKDIERAAVGSADVLKISTPSKREIVLTAAKLGRTSVTVWYAGGTSEQFMVSVVRDNSLLETALRSVWPGINVEIAGDRAAVVLTGTVPDEKSAERAQQVAQDYMNSGQGKDAGVAQVINLIKLGSAATTLETRIKTELERMGGTGIQVSRVSQGSAPDDGIDVFVLEGTMMDIDGLTNARELVSRLLPGESKKREERVISVGLKYGAQPGSIESVMEAAIHSLGCPKVRVRRVVNTEFARDGDIVVLDGSVPTQTHLVRAITLASKVFQQQEVMRKRRDGILEIERVVEANGTGRTYEREAKIKSAVDDVHVIADESGALYDEDENQSNFGSGANSVLGSGGGTGSASGSSFARLLTNQIGTNLARAKAIEMADGRLISFITVEDIPSVRVDIQLFEINRSALLSWNSAQSAAVSDFARPSTLQPTFTQNPVTGDFQEVPPQVPTTNEDVQNVISFLGGGIANHFQISGNHVEINSLLALLEREGIARTLSNPSLTVLSGELAFFGVGGSVPIETSIVTDFGSGAGQSGILNQTIERTFGIKLSVRPLVELDGMITMDVIPSVSQPDAALTRQIRESTGQSLSTTAFQERAMRTSARLRDGQTLLIGGLSARTRADESSQTPFLHQIPIIGNLFKGYSYDDQDRELVVVVNPVIVREAPVNAPMWAFPTTHELMNTVPTTASLKAQREAEAQAAKDKAAKEKAEQAARAQAEQEKAAMTATEKQ